MNRSHAARVSSRLEIASRRWSMLEVGWIKKRQYYSTLVSSFTYNIEFLLLLSIFNDTPRELWAINKLYVHPRPTEEAAQRSAHRPPLCWSRSRGRTEDVQDGRRTSCCPRHHCRPDWGPGSQAPAESDIQLKKFYFTFLYITRLGLNPSSCGKVLYYPRVFSFKF